MDPNLLLDKATWRRLPPGALLPLLFLLQLADKAMDCEMRDKHGFTACQYVPNIVLVGP